MRPVPGFSGSLVLLAAQLDLPVVDRTQSRDSHGAIVDTQIVQSDLSLGGATFRKVPIHVAELPHTARCLFDGVLGSELLTQCDFGYPRAPILDVRFAKKARSKALFDTGSTWAGWTSPDW